MKNAANYSLFVEGHEVALLHPFDHVASDPMQNLSVFYRLGALSAHAQNRPTLLHLSKELYREFSFCDTPLPNLAHICLNSKYSHRLLKEAFDYLGYHIPVNPDCAGFHAWRVK